MEKRYYVNYCTVHKVNGVENIFECDDEYILYNPYKHTWIIINSTGCEIIDAVNEYVTYTEIKSYFEKKYSFDSEFDFHNDVEFYLEYLVQRGFLSNEELSAPNWRTIIPDSRDITKYKFNEIYVSIEDVCNLNCIYCFNEASRSKRIQHASKRKMDVPKICSVLQEFKKLGGDTVVFTGGEPTLYPQFEELIREVSKIGLHIQIITNGTTLSKLSISNIIGYIDIINISIDSVVGEEVSFLWGKEDGEGELNNLFSGLACLKNAIDDGRYDTAISILPVVTKINYNSMVVLVRKINDFFAHKVHWKFTMYGDIGIEEIDKQLRIDEQEYCHLLFALAKEIDTGNDLIAQQSYAINSGNVGRLLPYPRTVSCTPSFLVTAKGDVYPCQGLECEENYLGNVYESKLEDLFYSDRFVDIREQLVMSEKNECFRCELKYVCTERCSICKTEKSCRKNCKDAVVRRMYFKVKGY